MTDHKLLLWLTIVRNMRTSCSVVALLLDGFVFWRNRRRRKLSPCCIILQVGWTGAHLRPA